MNEELPTDALLREFLLGKMDDEQSARIENLFLTDPAARERVLVIEQELIEDYLEDGLTPDDRERFVLRYGQTAAQQQQVRISKAIKDWAVRENTRAQPAVAEVSGWSRLRTKLRLKPVFVIPITVAAVISIVFGAVLIRGRMQTAAIAQEVAQLNTAASLREVPRDMVSLDLSPVLVRSVDSQNELKKSAETRVVELRLPWIQKERYQTYQAEVRRVNGDESFTIPNLAAENDGRYRVRLRLPARILNHGQYQVRLSGIDTTGTAGVTEEYAFTVDS